MKTCIIYNSWSGNTHSVAERVQAACGDGTGTRI